ncbi:MAG: hypothetical protein J6S85_01725 [Methanobrevibacter sp.]|nr:hypothetical protein [Methanobrevibacter sp.]MBO7712254.1 hypothetical protein [Methanobrevibacter sp.]
MKNYYNNMADQDVVVHSIKVLTEIKGGGITEIKRDVEKFNQRNELYQKQQEKYWKALSNDGIIKPFEKVFLKRETENIRQSFSALYYQAEQAEIVNTSYFSDYIRTYNELRAYLYDTLKLFDDMETETVIADRNEFNSYFSAYYYSEKFTAFAMAEGIVDTLGLRVLQSLSETGTNDEIAIYKGNIYQYIEGVWKAVGLEGYMGVMSSFPEATLNQYFLSDEDFVEDDVLYVNDEPLIINGTPLYVGVVVEGGYIYVRQSDAWVKITDKNDWRYVVAMVDLVRITGELPGVYQTAIDTAVTAAKNELNQSISNLSAGLTQEISDRAGQFTIINGDIIQINESIQDIIEDIDDITSAVMTKISHLPAYLGAKDTIPPSAQEGDYFVYSGTTTGSWRKSDVYRYEENGNYSGTEGSGHWKRLDPTESQNRSYYMLGLDDILRLNNANDGYFAALFASSFFAHDATLDTLATHTIYLRQNGHIMSDKLLYEEGEEGLCIDADGNLDANGNTHIAGKVAIGVPLKNSQGQLESVFNDYDVVIGGNTKIQGTLDGADGTFSGKLAGSEGVFTGGLDCEVMKIEKTLINAIESEVLNVNTTIYNVANWLVTLGYPTEYIDQSPYFRYFNRYVLIEDLLPDLGLAYHVLFYNDIALYNVRIDEEGVYFNNGQIKFKFREENNENSLDKPIIQKLAINARTDIKLKGLPNTKPDEQGIVYCLSDGILRVS